MEAKEFEKNLTRLKKEVGLTDTKKVSVAKVEKPAVKSTKVAKVAAKPVAEKKVIANVVTVKKLATEFKITPFQARRILRSKLKRDKGVRWEWAPDSKDLVTVKEIITKGLAAPAPAKKEVKKAEAKPAAKKLVKRGKE